MAINEFDVAGQKDGSHIVTRNQPTRVVESATGAGLLEATITLNDAMTDAETLVLEFGETTTTFEFDSDMSATGTAVTIGGSATATATNLATAIDNLGVTGLTVTDNLDGTIDLAFDATASAAGFAVKEFTGNIDVLVYTNSAAVTYGSTIVDGGMALFIDNSVLDTKPKVNEALKALVRAVQRENLKTTSPADYATSGTSTE